MALHYTLLTSDRKTALAFPSLDQRWFSCSSKEVQDAMVYFAASPEAEKWLKSRKLTSVEFWNGHYYLHFSDGKNLLLWKEDLSDPTYRHLPVYGEEKEDA